MPQLDHPLEEAHALPRVAWHRLLWIGLAAAYAVVTVVLVAYTARHLVPFGDWNVWQQVPNRLAEHRLYDHSDPSYTWAWSPLAAWLLAVVVLPMGAWVWGALHLAGLAILRDWRLIAFVGLSYPFWMDTLMGNTFVFSALTGYAAWRGSRWAAIAYLVLVVLMPRPVQLPLAALLLWRDRSLLLPFTAIAAMGIVTTVASGYSSDWVRVLIGIGMQYPSQEFNLSPTRILGPTWLVVGIPLAAWLTFRKRSGWAGLAMSPYLVPQYLLILLLEFRSSAWNSRPRFGRLDAAIVIYGAFAGVLAFFPLRDGHVFVVVALVAAPAAVLLRRRPYAAAAVMIVGSIVLRLGYVGALYADQIDVSQLAVARVLAGGNPYAQTYPALQDAIYSYGPLGMLVWLPGISVEVAAAAGTMMLLAYQRAWLTFGLFAAWPFTVELTPSGVNDYSAGFALMAALVLLRSRPKVGMAAVAVAVAIKPYAAAWVIPAAGFAGFTALGVFLAVSFVLWSPVLFVWGVSSYVTSVRNVQTLHQSYLAAGFPESGSINAPLLRWLVIPFSLAGLWLRDWRATLLLGSAGFFAFLFFSPWASGGYWVAVLPIVGLALESPAVSKGRSPVWGWVRIGRSGSQREAARVVQDHPGQHGQP